MLPEVNFSKLEEIYEKVIEILPPIECSFYKSEISKERNLKEQIKIAKKYTSLNCNHWICQDCFSTDYVELETEVVCTNCGTEDNYGYFVHIDGTGCEYFHLWTNSIQRNNIRAGLINYSNYQAVIDRFDKFKEKYIDHLLFKSIDHYKIKKDFKNLEKLFDEKHDEIKRKNFFLNKMIAQKLLEHYSLVEQPKKLSLTLKKVYSEFEALNWLN